jgi:N-acetylneuraminic acid mutarotase
MNYARVGHTATLLPSGLVLVAGGFGRSTVLASAELYDPASNTWSFAGSMVTARADHTATLLPSGQVLVAGGDDGARGIVASAELYDPASSTWSAVGSMVTPRMSHTATLLPSGQVLVAGGSDLMGISSGILASAELYDPASETWSVAGSMAAPRMSHTATLLPSGKVLVVGGMSTSTLLSSAELYDPASNTWTVAGSLATARDFHTATLMSSGKLLVAGGVGVVGPGPAAGALASTELYDPASNTWSFAGSMAAGRSAHTATLLLSGQVLAAGGALLPNAELYDPAGNTWSAAGPMRQLVASHTATLLTSSKVLVAGGDTGGPFGDTAAAELYDPQTQTAIEYYYADWNYYFVTSFPAEIATLDRGAFGGLWQRTGETFNVWPVSGGFASPTCRFFSVAFAPKSAHFYTPFPTECAIVAANPGWQFEAIAFYLLIPTGYGTGNGFCPQGTVALYRAYNNGMGGAPNHRYTTSMTTLNTMIAQRWVFEGEANTKVFACVPQ